MKRQIFISSLIVFLFTICLCPAMLAKDNMKQHNTMLIIDGSSHSNRTWAGKTKFKIMHTALSNTLAELNKTPSWGFNMGIRIFGDQSPRSKIDCMDIRLGSKLAWFEPIVMNSVLEGTKPKGRNCLTNAIASTSEDFAQVKPGSQNYIVCVITAPDECAKEERVTFE
ncbi:hypothetical protein K8T06_07135, partial [bacterium]|nr:hypothetical protein [bacterium]